MYVTLSELKGFFLAIWRVNDRSSDVSNLSTTRKPLELRRGNQENSLGKSIRAEPNNLIVSIMKGPAVIRRGLH